MELDTAPNYALLTSLRYDREEQDTRASPTVPSSLACHVWLFDFHLERLRSAARAHGWPRAARLSAEEFLCQISAAARACFETATGAESHSCKVRVLLFHDGSLQTSTSLVPNIPFTHLTRVAALKPAAPDFTPHGPVLRIVLDSESTTSSPFTSTKTTHRPQYNAARVRVSVPPLGTTPDPSDYHDVLLFNERHELTETSIRNVAFFRDGTWVTPPSSTGCLPGVVRRLLLEDNLVRETVQALKVDDVQDGEWLLLFNGVEGCRIGQLTVP